MSSGYGQRASRGGARKPAPPTRAATTKTTTTSRAAIRTGIKTTAGASSQSPASQKKVGIEIFMSDSVSFCFDVHILSFFR